MPLQQEYILAAKTEILGSGKIQCKLFIIDRNGKNKSIKAHSGTILKLALSKA